MELRGNIGVPLAPKPGDLAFVSCSSPNTEDDLLKIDTRTRFSEGIIGLHAIILYASVMPEQYNFRSGRQLLPVRNSTVVEPVGEGHIRYCDNPGTRL